MRCVCDEAPGVSLTPLLALIICTLILILVSLSQQGQTHYYSDNNSTVKTQYIGISTNGGAK